MSIQVAATVINGRARQKRRVNRGRLPVAKHKTRSNRRLRTGRRR